MEEEPSSFAENRIHSDTFFVCVFFIAFGLYEHYSSVKLQDIDACHLRVL